MILCLEKSISAVRRVRRGRGGGTLAVRGSSSLAKTVSTIIAQSKSWSRISSPPRTLEPKRPSVSIARAWYSVDLGRLWLRSVGCPLKRLGSCHRNHECP